MIVLGCLAFVSSAGVAFAYIKNGNRSWSFVIIGDRVNLEFDAITLYPDNNKATGKGIHGRWGESQLSDSFWIPFLDWCKFREPNARVLITQLREDNTVAFGVYSIGLPVEDPVQVAFPAATSGFTLSDEVLFAFDGSKVEPDEDTILTDVAKIMKDRRDLAVLIQGHTDRRGTSSYNGRLGARRARAVAAELVLRGVPEDRIYTVTFGKSKLKTSGDREEAHMQNRRVDFVFVPWAPLQ